jgi:hypothetical protein
MKITIILKDVAKTKLMQAAQVFEAFKFFGDTMDFETTTEKPAWEYFELIAPAFKVSPLELVGVIIHDGDAYVLHNHRVISDGNRWYTVENIIANSSSKMCATV